jgi:hypothetical protein
MNKLIKESAPEKLKLVTPDGRLLTLIAIGKPDQEKGCSTLTCKTEKGVKVEVELPGFVFFGSYWF